MLVELIPERKLRVTLHEDSTQIQDSVYDFLRMASVDRVVDVVSVEPWQAQIEMLPDAIPEELVRRTYDAARGVTPAFINIRPNEAFL